MKTILRTFLLPLMVLPILSACERVAMEETGETEQPNSLLQVTTRAGGNDADATISYPVYVYVFDADQQCVALQTISNATQALSIPLTEGNYTVYAIGGATSDAYNLPTQQTATLAMPITLKEGASHTDLMVAQSNIELSDGETNLLNLSLQRKVMRLQGITLSRIPSAATAVSVTISPLWQSLSGTDYAGSSASATVQLTRQEDLQTWAFSGTRYLLPPSANNVAMTVRIVKPNGTTTYTYNLTDQSLTAGSTFHIESTYAGQIEVTLTGTLTGDIWQEEKTIAFTFDENNQTASEDNPSDDPSDSPSGNTDSSSGDSNLLTGSIPSKGDTFMGCYVLSVGETDANGVAEVLLLSPNQTTVLTGGETNEEVLSKIEAALPSCAVEGISGWRLMTDAEATIAIQVTTPKIPNVGLENNYFYLRTSDGKVRMTKLSASSLGTGYSYKNTDLLRPVATVRIKNE